MKDSWHPVGLLRVLSQHVLVIGWLRRHVRCQRSTGPLWGSQLLSFTLRHHASGSSWHTLLNPNIDLLEFYIYRGAETPVWLNLYRWTKQYLEDRNVICSFRLFEVVIFYFAVPRIQHSQLDCT